MSDQLIKLPTLSNLLQKIIIQNICNKINSNFKSFKKENNYHYNLLNLSLVNWFWFNYISSLLTVSINFNYDLKFNSLIINNRNYEIEEIPSYKEDKNGKYSILKIDNIKTIKLDYLFLYNESCFYQRIFGPNYRNDTSDFKLLKFPNYKEIFKKLIEIRSLKRILIKTHCFSMRCLEYHFGIEELIEMGFQNIQFSHLPISNKLMKSIQLIKKSKALVLNSKDEQNMYDMVKYFNSGLKQIYFISEMVPIKQLAGINLNEEQINHCNINLIKFAISDGYNYFKNIKYIEISTFSKFENLCIIINSTPNLKELTIKVCFNHLVFSLSNEKEKKSLGFKNDFFCIGGCCYENSNENKINKSNLIKNEILEYYPLLLESLKSSKLNKLVLNHGCEVFPKRMDSSDVINNKHFDKYYLSFLDSFTKLIMAISQLNRFEICGINNPIIFKYLIRKLDNKTIKHYKQKMGFSKVPKELGYELFFKNLLKDYNHIESFIYSNFKFFKQ